ncbi:hypothetical protein KQI46_00985 [Lysinibacillus capsici]|uniref:hypothetical protein n=1 Tax=Lysinibacillus capsici TaxID=2115968 RepID=UPI001C1166DD|nr:hypothetical protein [Lysinibacillus capsici]MBU5250534.1 hypothetical protein [Lysinibacillus capsici]
MNCRHQLREMYEAYREIEINKLLSELEDFNKRNYKDAAIDVALATGDREAFNKLVGSE